MKQLLYFALTILLVLSISCNCFAAGNEVAINDVNGGPGQTIYLALELQEPVTASAIGVRCQYDAELLEALPELSTWEIKGLLSSFEKENNGVWASATGQELKGKLCVLAFRIKDGVAFNSTDILCTVILKDGSTEKVNCTVKSTVSCQCTHNYGPWESTGNMNHIRTCTLCGGKNTQNHEWDSGVKETRQNGQVLLVKTCVVCKTKNVTDITSTEQETSHIPGVNDENEENHNHDAVVIPTTKHNHDHSDLVQDEHNHEVVENDPVTIWIVLLLPVLLIAVAIIFVKKR